MRPSVLDIGMVDRGGVSPRATRRGVEPVPAKWLLSAVGGWSDVEQFKYDG